MTSKVIIFTDLDGTLLDRDTFKFDTILSYIKDLILKDVYIIPNSSKTRQEIENFNQELDENLSFVVENGAAIYKLNFNPSLYLNATIEYLQLIDIVHPVCNLFLWQLDKLWQDPTIL